MNKRCSKCQKTFPIETFQLRLDRGKIRRRECCPKCHAKETRKWRKQNAYIKESDRVLTMEQLAQRCRSYRFNGVGPITAIRL